MTDPVPPSTLHITEKLLSVLGKLRIADDSGKVLYECASQWAWIGQSWVLTRDQRQEAFCRRKLWALTPTWTVQAGDERFILRRHLWSLRRRVSVHGGRFDGAELTGNLFDLKFSLTWQGRTLARARGKLLSLRDRHDIDVLDPAAELLTVILMANLMIDRRTEQGHQAATPGTLPG